MPGNAQIVLDSLVRFFNQLGFTKTQVRELVPCIRPLLPDPMEATQIEELKKDPDYWSKQTDEISNEMRKVAAAVLQEYSDLVKSGETKALAWKKIKSKLILQEL